MEQMFQDRSADSSRIMKFCIGLCFLSASMRAINRLSEDLPVQSELDPTIIMWNF